MPGRSRGAAAPAPRPFAWGDGAPQPAPHVPVGRHGSRGRAPGLPAPRLLRDRVGGRRRNTPEGGGESPRTEQVAAVAAEAWETPRERPDIPEWGPRQSQILTAPQPPPRPAARAGTRGSAQPSSRRPLPPGCPHCRACPDTLLLPSGLAKNVQMPPPRESSPDPRPLSPVPCDHTHPPRRGLYSFP